MKKRQSFNKAKRQLIINQVTGFGDVVRVAKKYKIHCNTITKWRRELGAAKLPTKKKDPTDTHIKFPKYELIIAMGSGPCKRYRFNSKDRLVKTLDDLNSFSVKDLAVYKKVDIDVKEKITKSYSIGD